VSKCRFRKILALNCWARIQSVLSVLLYSLFITMQLTMKTLVIFMVLLGIAAAGRGNGKEPRECCLSKFRSNWMTLPFNSVMIPKIDCWIVRLFLFRARRTHPVCGGAMYSRNYLQGAAGKGMSWWPSPSMQRKKGLEM
jgi:hypothetical protein